MQVANCIGGGDAIESGKDLSSMLRNGCQSEGQLEALPESESRRLIADSVEGNERITGRIRRVFYDKEYGFISTEMGDIYFQFGYADSPEYIAVGAEVSFKIKMTDDGRAVATKIKVDKPAPMIDEDKIISGHVKKIMRNYGFIFGEDGHDYFFHEAHVTASGGFHSLAPGTNVMFKTSRSDKGLVALNVDIRD